MVLPRHPGRARQRQQAIQVVVQVRRRPPATSSLEASRMTRTAGMAGGRDPCRHHDEHEGRDDRWNLTYAEPWIADAKAYPLSPALPLAPGT